MLTIAPPPTTKEDSDAVIELVHQLQRERGVTCGWVAACGSSAYFGKDLPVRREQSDKALQQVESLEWARELIQAIRAAADAAVSSGSWPSADSSESGGALEPSADTAHRKTAADLCDAAFSGDLVRLRGYIDDGLDPDTGDYDQRTAMHLAASEGLLEVVRFLTDEAGANPSPVDRWGNTPLDDASRLNHAPVIDFLNIFVGCFSTGNLPVTDFFNTLI